MLKYGTVMLTVWYVSTAVKESEVVPIVMSELDIDNVTVPVGVIPLRPTW